jgi:hypothetical protein
MSISPEKREILRHAFERGLIARLAGEQAGVPRSTASKYFHQWRCPDATTALQRYFRWWRSAEVNALFVQEASRRRVTVAVLAETILNNVARDDLFKAVLDD